jgi:membrane protein DedA with SNARE-associated domain/membrane-associated phospholipid phosphatase
MHYLNPLLSFITQHPDLCYGAIFLTALSESLALVGLLVPGTVIMFGVGAVVATGRLDLFPVLLLAMAGAVAGDGVSYWLGHHYKGRLVTIWPFSRYPAMLARGTAFFRRHGGKSVLFGRFVGPVRPVIPVVAGMLGMAPVRFAMVNVLSAVGWALVYILPGVFFGASLAVAGAVSTRLAVLAFIFVAGIWSFIWMCRKAVSLFEEKGPAWLAALKHWATIETPAHGLGRPLKQFFSFLLFRKKGEEYLFGFLALVFFAAGWGFLGILQDVLAKDPLVVADQAVYHFLQSLRTPWADSVFVAVTEFGDSFVNMALALAVLLVLLVKRCRRAAGFWILAVLGGLSAVQLLKWAMHLPRPVTIYRGASAFGFPSGHTTMSLVLYGFLAILMVRRFAAGVGRWGLFAGVMLIALVIGFSRLYLGAHWLSDVLGGYFIGMSWVTLLGIAYLKGPDEAIPRRLLGLVAALVIVVAGGWHVAQRHGQDRVRYAPRHHVASIPLATWLADGWRRLPAYRIDMAGEREQPLTLQWAGPPDELAHYLLSKGWQPPPPLNAEGFLRILSPETPIAKLPVLPRLHNGRVDILRLVAPVDDTRRWVLRLWPTDMKIADNGAPLFVGTLEIQNRRQLADLVFLARDSGAYGAPLNRLEAVLKERFTVLSVHRRNNAMHAEDEERHVVWQGRVLLIESAGNLRGESGRIGILGEMDWPIGRLDGTPETGGRGVLDRPDPLACPLFTPERSPCRALRNEVPHFLSNL